MDKFLVDFTKLDTKVNGPKVFKLADVQDRIQKVAFDVVRFRDNADTDQLWKIEDSSDGPVIVAMYDSELADEVKVAEASASGSDWGAIADSATSVNVFYKGEAVKRIVASDVGIDDVSLLCRWLPTKLASDKGFRSSLVSEMSKESRDFLLSKYPELKG